MKKIDRYAFPAVLTYATGFEIAVTFPDFSGCATSGATEIDAISSAREALGLHIWGMEIDGEQIPLPTNVSDIKLDDKSIVTIIDVYMPTIRFSQENKSVNRTVTLPAWLDARAKEYGVNFSQLLQEAIKRELNI